MRQSKNEVRSDATDAVVDIVRAWFDGKPQVTTPADALALIVVALHERGLLSLDDASDRSQNRPMLVSSHH